MTKNKKIFKNQKQMYQIIAIIAIVSSAFMLGIFIGEEDGYSKSQKQYEEQHKEDITQYDLYVMKQKAITLGGIILAFGVALGLGLHGFAIIKVSR